MSSEVETMMSVREVPWHGLGNVIEEAPDSKGALKEAGLDWTVGLEPVWFKENGEYLEQPERITVRSDTRKPLGIVGPKYQPIQNHEMFDFADALLDTGEVKFETAGSLRNGKLVWALAKIERPVVIAGDEIIPYLVLSNTHNGWQAFRAMTTPVRVVCANTLQMAMKSARSSWSVRHSGDPIQKLDEARMTLDITYDYYDAFAEEIAQLIDTEVTDHRFNSIVSRLIPKGTTDRAETARKTQRSEIEAIYRGPTVTPFDGTGWGVVNAVSDWELWGKANRSKRSRFEIQADKILNQNATPLANRAHQMIAAN